MRKHLADFRLMVDSGGLVDAVELLPEHQAALRYDSVEDYASRGESFSAHHFYKDGEDSLFSDVLIYGDLEDLKKFHLWIRAFLRSGRDYDFRRIFTINLGKYFHFVGPTKGELISKMLDHHFEFLLALMGSVDSEVLASSVSDELKSILASVEFPVLYIVFVDFLSQNGLSAEEAANMLIGLSPVEAKDGEARIYYLVLLNKLLQNNLEFTSAYQIFSALLFPTGPVVVAPGYFRSLPLGLVLDTLIKLRSHAGADLGQLSQAFSILKYLIVSEEQVGEYLGAIRSFSTEQALAIHFELLQRYEGFDLSGKPIALGVYLKLVDALRSFSVDLPTICEFLIKLNFDGEDLSRILNHVIASFKGGDHEKKKQVVDLVYRLITNEEFLAKPKNMDNLQNLAYVVIEGKTLKELIFEHMQEYVPSELRVRLFQGIIDQFTGRASPSTAGDVTVDASASSAVIAPVIVALTAFFSQSRGFTPASLGSGVLKKINDVLRNVAELDMAVEKPQAPRFLAGFFSQRSPRDSAEETLISAVTDASVKLCVGSTRLVDETIDIIAESYIAHLDKSSKSITNADKSVRIVMKVYEAITLGKISDADRKSAETAAHDFIDPRVVDSSDLADNNRL